MIGAHFLGLRWMGKCQLGMCKYLNYETRNSKRSAIQYAMQMKPPSPSASFHAILAAAVFVPLPACEEALLLLVSFVPSFQITSS